jgi:hypothetical protein
MQGKGSSGSIYAILFHKTVPYSKNPCQAGIFLSICKFAQLHFFQPADSAASSGFS